jgi:hypothetical protein
MRIFLFSYLLTIPLIFNWIIIVIIIIIIVITSDL